MNKEYFKPACVIVTINASTILAGSNIGLDDSLPFNDNERNQYSKRYPKMQDWDYFEEED